MANTVMNQEVINGATFTELQTLATENGIKASGKGITADFLRMQLNALISTNEEPSVEEIPEALIFDGNPVPKPVEESEQQDVQKMSTKNKPNNIKLQKLVYEKGIYSWQIEYRPRARGLKEADVVAIAFKIAENIYRMPNSNHAVIADKEMVDAYKVNAIFGKVLGTDSKLDIQNAVLFFRQMQWLVPATMSTKTVYFVTKRLYEFMAKYTVQEEKSVE